MHCRQTGQEQTSWYSRLSKLLYKIFEECIKDIIIELIHLMLKHVLNNRVDTFVFTTFIMQVKHGNE